MQSLLKESFNASNKNFQPNACYNDVYSSWQYCCCGVYRI